jgi:hypothetical protein
LWEKLRTLGYVSENRPAPTVGSPEVDRFGRVLARISHTGSDFRATAAWRTTEQLR